MGNQCKGEEENISKVLKSGQKLVDFVKEKIEMFINLNMYQENKDELQKLLKFNDSINLSNLSQALENDHYITLQKIKTKDIKKDQQKFQQHLKEFGVVNLEESNLILNQFNLSYLQFQDLYICVNSLQYQRSPIVDESNILKNKQICEKENQIICEKQLYQMFVRISNKKFIVYQLIDIWIREIKSKNLKLIIQLVSLITSEIYCSIKISKVPEKIYEIVIIWMVQTIVFNNCPPQYELSTYEHLLDYVFYYRCPIEKLMILYAQYKLLRFQFVIRDSDELADRLNALLKSYPRANLLKNEIQLIVDYVEENWFITLDNILKQWQVISQRF